MPILGSAVQDTNFRLRFCLIAFSGIVCFGAVLLWRASLLMTVEYQEFPVTHEQIKIINHNRALQHLQAAGGQTEE